MYTKSSATPFATIPKTGSNLNYTFATNTSIPAETTTILAFTKNAAGDSVTANAAALFDCVGGTPYVGGCWYVSNLGESCDTACVGRGGTTAPTRTFAGSAGHASKCSSIANLLGYSSGVGSTTGNGKGCTVANIAGDSVLFWESTTTTGSASEANRQRICSCRY